MREINEILNNPKIIQIFRNNQNIKSIQFKMDIKLDTNNNDEYALVKFTQANDWEHLSVSFQNKTPTWDNMQECKEIFWKDNEYAFQLHPTKENYINNHEHCLHIWRNLKQDLIMPPTIMVRI